MSQIKTIIENDTADKAKEMLETTKSADTGKTLPETEENKEIKKESFFRQLDIPPAKKAIPEGILVLVTSIVIAAILAGYTFGLDKLFGLIIKILFPESA